MLDKSLVTYRKHNKYNKYAGAHKPPTNKRPPEGSALVKKKTGFARGSSNALTTNGHYGVLVKTDRFFLTFLKYNSLLVL
jgi:hypothetical protein